MIRLAILLSGRGSNFQAIHQAIVDGKLEAEIVCVISNRPEAPGLALAREVGLAAHAIDQGSFSSRAAHEEDVLRVLADARPDFICLAGYMRLLTPAFIAAYPHRIINIHPSLLPAFPGIDAQVQAVQYGVKVSGCSVHFVDENLDAGPILVQRAVQIRDDDTPESLAKRILGEEHVAYVEALVKLSRGGYRIEGRRVLFE